MTGVRPQKHPSDRQGSHTVLFLQELLSCTGIPACLRFLPVVLLRGVPAACSGGARKI